MKIRLLFLLSLALGSLAASAQGSFYKDGNRAKFNAPEGITEDEEMLFPTWDYITEPQIVADTFWIDVTQCVTYVKTDTLTANPVVGATVADFILPGCVMYIQFYNDTCTFATDVFTAPSIAVPTGKIKMQEFIWEGSKFRPTSTGIQLN